MQLLLVLPLIAVASAIAITAFPPANGSVILPACKEISGTFDGWMQRFERGKACTGQLEADWEDAVFVLDDGATLKNAIIGKNNREGVHCRGSCTVKNVWWEDVCEDALTLHQQTGTSQVIGGGARYAEDKIIQHDGCGEVVIQDFYADTFGKVYRSCGNCKKQCKRDVKISGVIAKNGKWLAGANSNYGDTVVIKKTCTQNVKKICSSFMGNTNGKEPVELTTGPDEKVCLYNTSDISSNC